MPICAANVVLLEARIDVAKAFLGSFLLKKISQLAFCGIASSISVSLLFLSSLVCFLQYSITVLSGVLIVMVALVSNLKNSFLVYMVVSIISLFFVLNKEVVFLYIFFVGFYPQTFVLSYKIKNKILRFSFKLAVLLALSLFLNLVFLCLFTPYAEQNKIMENNLFILNSLYVLFTLMLYDRFLHFFVTHHFTYIKNRFFKNM